MAKNTLEFKDWLVIRLWGRYNERTEICVLTTRGYLLSRHLRMDIKRGIHHKGINIWKKIPGLRRYKTEKMAKIKAKKLNGVFSTIGFSVIREDQV